MTERRRQLQLKFAEAEFKRTGNALYVWDGLYAVLAFLSEVAEAALANVVESKVEAAYRRGDLFDKRKRLIDGQRFARRGREATLCSSETRKHHQYPALLAIVNDLENG